MPLGAAGHDKFTFRFNYTGPKGGRIGVYTIGEDAKPVPVLDTGKLTMNPGESEGSDNAKANDKLILTKTEKNAPIWAFSAPGTYTLTATAVAANTVQSRFSGRTAPLTVTFKVGDRSISGDEPAAPAASPAPRPARKEDPTPPTRPSRVPPTPRPRPTRTDPPNREPRGSTSTPPSSPATASTCGPKDSPRGPRSSSSSVTR